VKKKLIEKIETQERVSTDFKVVGVPVDEFKHVLRVKYKPVIVEGGELIYAPRKLKDLGYKLVSKPSPPWLATAFETAKKIFPRAPIKAFVYMPQEVKREPYLIRTIGDVIYDFRLERELTSKSEAARGILHEFIEAIVKQGLMASKDVINGLIEDLLKEAKIKEKAIEKVLKGVSERLYRAFEKPIVEVLTEAMLPYFLIEMEKHGKEKA
jgi:hypothetical protein